MTPVKQTNKQLSPLLRVNPGKARKSGKLRIAIADAPACHPSNGPIHLARVADLPQESEGVGRIRACSGSVDVNSNYLDRLLLAGFCTCPCTRSTTPLESQDTSGVFSAALDLVAFSARVSQSSTPQSQGLRRGRYLVRRRRSVLQGGGKEIARQFKISTPDLPTICSA